MAVWLRRFAKVGDLEHPRHCRVILVTHSHNIRFLDVLVSPANNQNIVFPWESRQTSGGCYSPSSRMNSNEPLEEASKQFIPERENVGLVQPWADD